MLAAISTALLWTVVHPQQCSVDVLPGPVCTVFWEGEREEGQVRLPGAAMEKANSGLGVREGPRKMGE